MSLLKTRKILFGAKSICADVVGVYSPVSVAADANIKPKTIRNMNAENTANEALTATLKEFGFAPVAFQKNLIEHCRKELIALRPYADAGLAWIVAVHAMTRRNIEGGIAQFGSLEAYKANLSAAWVRAGGLSGIANEETMGLAVVMRGAAQTEVAGLLADNQGAFAAANA